MPSRTRFELLDGTESRPESTIQETTPESADEDPNADWRNPDFPPSPWRGARVTPTDEVKESWICGEFTPFLHDFDAQWAYIYDLDRDAFSVNSAAHFRLSNMPAGFTRYIEYTDDTEIDVVMPEKLDDVHLAWNVFPEPPVIDQDLLNVYNAAQVSIMDPPEMYNHPKNVILSTLQSGLRRKWKYDREASRKWDEWTPADRQMQRLVWTFVRYSMWDGLTFVSEYRDYAKKNWSWWQEVDPVWKELEQLPSTIPMPTEPDYYVLTGTNKVLVSLATNLDEVDTVEVAVAKIINLTPEGTVQVACIISLQYIVIVNIDKTSPQVIVTHTQPLDYGVGMKALIATLSPPYSHPSHHLSNTGVLPIEIVEHISKYVLLTGHVKTITNFASTCKLFAEIVRFRAVKIGRCVLLNFPTSQPGMFWGLDEEGGVELYRLYYVADGLEKQRRSFRISADGVNIGFGEYDLISLKDCPP